MKRLSVFSILVLGAVLLAACIGTGQATVNPVNTSTPLGAGTGLQPSTNLTPGTGQSVGTVLPPVAGVQETQVPSGLTETSPQQTSQPFNSTATVGNVPNTGATQAVGNLNNENGSQLPQDYPTSTAMPPWVVGNVATEFPTEHPPFAQDPNPTVSAASTNSFVRLQDLMNYSMVNSFGTAVGQVQDFVVNLDQGQVNFLVVAANGRKTLVPWVVISHVDQVKRVVHLSSFGDVVQSAPAFDENGVDFNNPQWSDRFNSFWQLGTGSAAGSGSPAGSSSAPSAGNGVVGVGSHAILSSKLLSSQVVTTGFNFGANASQQSNLVLGNVQDGAVDLGSGQLSYALIGTSVNVPGLGNRLVPVPFTAFQRNVVGDTLYLTIDINVLRSAPNFDLNQLPNLLGNGLDASIVNYWASILAKNGIALPTTQP